MEFKSISKKTSFFCHMCPWITLLPHLLRGAWFSLGTSRSVVRALQMHQAYAPL